jgi:acetoin utilization deacetylase AcuC-like enzyme
MKGLIPVFYTPKMVAESGCESPSAAKPVKVVEAWSKFPIQIIEPSPVTVEELARAHDWTWVEEVLACKAPNGFGNKSSAVAASLPYTSGSMLSAARYAFKHGGVAVAPCSGFHHAAWSKAQGFCTFNGLMVTACALQAEGAIGRLRVGILDLDMHYGNGTDDILKHVNSENWCVHFTAGEKFYQPAHAPRFFEQWLPAALGVLSDCEIVLYQAGADPHVRDPFGGWLTTEELRLRDAMVFDALGARGVPVVWNLAGGYQVEKDGSIPRVLEIHDNTMRECVRVFGGVS